MNAKVTIAAALAVLLFKVQSISAQEYSEVPGITTAYVQGAPPLGYGSYNFGVGTYESSVLEGAGKLLQGAGYYNLSTSQAIDTLERARSKAIKNYRDAIDTRYAIKQANETYRHEQYAKEQMSPELLSRVIKAKLPDPLSDAQYNRRTHELVWPSVLMTREFSNDRRAIDQAFAHQCTEDVKMASTFYREVSWHAQRMHDTMLSHIGNLSTTDSVAARRFLKSVEFNARHLAWSAL
jgi:hypothetical protein